MKIFDNTNSVSKLIFNNNIKSKTSMVIVNNTLIIAYSDNNNYNYGTIIIATIDNDNFILKNKIVFNDNYTSDISITHINDNTIAIIYLDGIESYGKVMLATIDNYNIKFKESIVFSKRYTGYISSIYDNLRNGLIIAYSQEDPSYGIIKIGKIIDTDIIFSKPMVFNNRPTTNISTTYDYINGTIIIAYNSNDVVYDSDEITTRYYGKCTIGKLNDMSVTFGQSKTFNIRPKNNDMSMIFKQSKIFNIRFKNNDISAIYDDINNKIIIFYSGYYDNHYRGEYIVGTVSGNSIVFNDAVLFGKDIYKIHANYDDTNNKIIITYIDNKSNKGRITVGTINNDSITFSNKSIFIKDKINRVTSVYNTTNHKVIIAFNYKDVVNCAEAIIYNPY